MKTQVSTIMGLSFLVLVGCQAVPKPYNGVTGYSIESQTDQSAVISYTLSTRANQAMDERKLQRVCQEVLGKQKNYQITRLSQQEIANPAFNQRPPQGMQVGDSRVSIGFSHTPELHTSETYATRQALEARPSTLTVIRYSCQ